MATHPRAIGTGALQQRLCALVLWENRRHCQPCRGSTGNTMKTPSTFEYQDDFDRTCFVNLSLWEAAQKLGISLTVMVLGALVVPTYLTICLCLCHEAVLVLAKVKKDRCNNLDVCMHLPKSSPRTKGLPQECKQPGVRVTQRGVYCYPGV